MTRRPFLALVPLLALAAAGCGPAKLDYKKSDTVDPGESKLYELPTQPKPQRLTVEFKSNEPVTVGVYNAADVKEDAILPESKARKVERAQTSGTLVVDLAPGDATTITVSGLGKKAAFEIQATNRK